MYLALLIIASAAALYGFARSEEPTKRDVSQPSPVHDRRPTIIQNTRSFTSYPVDGVSFTIQVPNESPATMVSESEYIFLSPDYEEGVRGFELTYTIHSSTTIDDILEQRGVATTSNGGVGQFSVPRFSSVSGVVEQEHWLVATSSVVIEIVEVVYGNEEGIYSPFMRDIRNSLYLAREPEPQSEIEGVPATDEAVIADTVSKTATSSEMDVSTTTTTL